MDVRLYDPVIRRSNSPVGFVGRPIGPRWICRARHVTLVNVRRRPVLAREGVPNRPAIVPALIRVLHRFPVAPSNSPGSGPRKVNPDRPTTARISDRRRASAVGRGFLVSNHPVRRTVRGNSRSSNAPDRHRAPA
ncbi:hypothetical protein ACFV24_21635 [Nocardia fluminea]|uniref:hypothetical protein n=1 Tax=Nocardia fluminea TaxID=134984 RepID=UPI003673200C